MNYDSCNSPPSSLFSRSLPGEHDDPGVCPLALDLELHGEGGGGARHVHVVVDERDLAATIQSLQARGHVHHGLLVVWGRGN